MALIHRDIPGIYNGVSQQSPPLRLPNQVEEQLNFLSSVTSGIERRPGTKHLAHLSGSHADKNTLSYPFRDSEGRDYLMLFTGHQDEPVEIYLLDGTKCSVSYEGGAKSYLTDHVSGVARNDYRVSAIADYAMVVNRNVICEMTDDTTPTQDPFALLWIKKGVVSTTYSVGGIRFTTEDSTTATDVSTGTIASELVSLLTESGVSAVQLDDDSCVIRITGTQEYIDNLTSSDSYGNSASLLLKGKAQKIEDLPPTAQDGDIIEIARDDTGLLAGYYMKYSKADGLWTESVKPGSRTKLDGGTLPHQLIRTDVTEFLFREAVEDEENNRPGWMERKAGDDISAPLPSFIGGTIRDIFYHKNRLGLLSGQNIVLSKPNDYFNFFPDTVSTTLDTDPTDRAVGFNEPVLLEWAVPFKEDLLLFSRNRQFVMSSGTEVFAADTAMIDPVTNFPCSGQLRPSSLGPSLVFVSDNADHTLVREYFVQADTLQNDAADITAHCPEYLPARMSRSVHLANSGILLLWSETTPSQLWVYRYYWSGNEKPQSSWSRFDFPFDILAFEQFDEIIYLVICQNSEIRLSSLELSRKESYCFDEMFDCSDRVYDAATDTTKLTFPYATDRMMALAHEPDSGLSYQGFSILDANARYLVVAGDLTSGVVRMGQPFSSSCTFSEFFVSPDGKTGALQGRLQLRSFTLSFATSGDFHLCVSYPGRETVTHNYTGVVVGEAEYGTRSLRSERKRFLLRGDSRNVRVTLIVDGILPGIFDSISFEGTYHARTQRTP